MDALFLEVIVPAPDPLPLPAPWWVLKVLLLVTFVLHLAAMNGALGSGVIAAVARLRRGGDKEGPRRLAGHLAGIVPSLVAATITLGVGALLFVQVLYGQALYTSSIVMAWPWLGTLGLLVLGYYGFYRAAARARRGPGAPGGLLAASALLFVVIAFLFTSNMTLALTPEKWAARVHEDPSGWNLNLDEPTLIPRTLHFFVASAAVGGLLVVLLGLRRRTRDPEHARYLIRHGGRWFVFATLIQIPAGIGFLTALPREKMLLFMGRNLPATVFLALGVLGSLLAVALMAGALRAEDPRRRATAAVGVTGGVIVLMVLVRDALRGACLAPHIDPARFAVKTQGGPLALFLGLFLAGAGLWVWMLVRHARSGAQPAPPG